MLSPLAPPSRLVTGARLNLEAFLEEWEAQLDVKHAELIDGIVYMRSPVGREHASRHGAISLWLGQYAEATPGCGFGIDATWQMFQSAPQPDAFLRILPECGGQSSDQSNRYSGAPELIVEICMTSTEVDFGPKLALYQRAGVREYITVEVLFPRIIWRVLQDGCYSEIKADPDGILRSRYFPGLWLDTAAFWAGAGQRVTAALRAGMASEEHARFAARLAAQGS